VEKESQSTAAKSLSRNEQLSALAIAGATVVLVFFVLPLVWHALTRQPQPALPKFIAGQFRPTHDQMADLTIGRVSLHAFAGLVETDGIVATNDDTTTPVYSPFSGAVTRILARAGDQVKKGAPLMVVAATEAIQTESDLISAVDAERAAQASLKNATESEARQQALYEAGSVALKDWHQAQVDLTTAQTVERSASAVLNATRGKLGILGFSAKQIDSLERTRGTMAVSPEATLFAPISGTVIQRQVGPGQFIQAGASTPVFSIGESTRLWLTGNVREEDAARMRVGEPVDVRLTAIPGRVFHTKLFWVASAIDATTHRLVVRAELDNPDGLIRPAMFASLAIHTGGDRLSPSVPESAVVREGDTTHVWVAYEDGNLGLRAIVAGRLEDGQVEVLSGLKAGEKFVHSGALFVDNAAQGN
jgi:cobalt-zinc-cadmium efflux system membrane fusion protein